MNSISLLVLLVLCMTTSVVVGQAINDKLSLFMEYLHPGWRKHRARYSPYAFVDPVHLWRLNKRSMSDDSEDLVQCIYSSDKVLCYRNDNDYLECDAKLNFANPLLQEFTTFGIDQIKQTEQMTKFNLLAKIPADIQTPSNEYAKKNFRGVNQSPISLHSDDNTEDDGLTVNDNDCWGKLVEFLKKSNTTKKVNVERVNVKNMVWSEKTNIIANLHVIPEDSYLSF